MTSERQLHFVWSKRVRIFHWLNVIAITLLIFIGLIIFNSKSLGVSTDGKVLLKTLHVCVGYIFAVNLLVRIVVGFIGKQEEHWRSALPFVSGFKGQWRAFRQENSPIYKGHSPAGKLMVGALFALMLTQAVSGLVLAGTDIYYPPFGEHFATSIALDKNKVAMIKPYSKENVEEKAYQAMREFRSPFITAHIYAFYGLILLIPLHIGGVIIAERKEKSGLVSAMIHGYKSLPKK